MCAFGADAADDVLDVLYLESLRNMNLGDSFVFEAIGTATYRTGDMYVLAALVVMVLMSVVSITVCVTACCAVSSRAYAAVMAALLADAVLLLSGPIVKRMQQVVLDKERQRAEDGAAVNGGEYSLNVGHGKGIVEGNERAPYQYAYGSGPYAMLLQQKSCLFVHVSVLFSKRRPHSRGDVSEIVDN